jgi:hypothetical protein
MEKINPTKDTAQAQLQAIISRVKPAAEQLLAAPAGPAGLAADRSDQVDEVLYKGIRIVEMDNSLQIYFKGIPPQKIRTYLRKKSFQWFAKDGCWKRARSPEAMFYAENAIDKLDSLINSGL